MIWLLAPLMAFGAGKKRPTDQERGKELYERHCQACHGDAARGDGPLSNDLVVAIPDLQGRVKTKIEAQKFVLKGKGLMPSFEASFDLQDSRKVLKYMAQLKDVAKPLVEQPAPSEVPAPAKETPPPEN